jgi:hypothetical protein
MSYLKDELRKQIEHWIVTNTTFKRGLFVTTNVWENLADGKDDRTIQTIQRRHKDFIRHLEKRIFNKHTQRIQNICFVHTQSKNKRNHIHTILQIPTHLKTKCFKKDVEKAMFKTKGLSNELNMKQVHNMHGVVSYGCKEQKQTYEYNAKHTTRYANNNTLKRIDTDRGYLGNRNVT